MIDNKYDFRNDVKINLDPDIHSKILKSYHKKLWSKPLPSGKEFSLSDTEPSKYLFHKSSIGEFSLSSDSIAISFIRVKKMSHIIDEINNKRKEEILKVLYTIGVFLIFPANRISNKLTINGAKGFNSRIVDRFDLTLECIRRYYLNIKSPLSETFNRYQDFFSLFENFQGYVEFFLLQDLVKSDFIKIKFFLPFDETFPSSPYPKDINDYNIFINNTLEFVQKRGLRMKTDPR